MDIRQKGYGRYAGMLQRPVNVGASFGSSPAVPQITPQGMNIPPAAPAPAPVVPMPSMPVTKTATDSMPTISPVMPSMPSIPSSVPTPTAPDTTTKDEEEDTIGHMPKAPTNLPPAVQDMMKQALSQGVQVQGAPVIQSLGLPKVPTVNLDDIVPTDED